MSKFVTRINLSISSVTVNFGVCPHWIFIGKTLVSMFSLIHDWQVARVFSYRSADVCQIIFKITRIKRAVLYWLTHGAL